MKSAILFCLGIVGVGAGALLSPVLPFGAGDAQLQTALALVGGGLFCIGMCLGMETKK